jgi:hypothetical protein
MLAVRITGRGQNLYGMPLATAKITTDRREFSMWFCIEGDETIEELEQLAREVFYVSGTGTAFSDVLPVWGPDPPQGRDRPVYKMPGKRRGA